MTGGERVLIHVVAVVVVQVATMQVVHMFSVRDRHMPTAGPMDVFVLHVNVAIRHQHRTTD